MALIENAKVFQFNMSLAEFYDYESLGDDRMSKEYGRFSDCGYTVFQKLPEVLDELLSRDQSEEMTMS